LSGGRRSGLASCRRLPRDKSKLGGEIAAAREGLRVTDRCEKGSCIQGTHAWNAGQSPSSLIAFQLCSELAVETRDPLIERLLTALAYPQLAALVQVVA
jgi:hypothetical protein